MRGKYLGGEYVYPEGENCQWGKMCPEGNKSAAKLSGGRKAERGKPTTIVSINHTQKGSAASFIPR